MKHKTAQELIDFEHRIVSLFKSGSLPFLIHLAGGNEDQLIAIFNEAKPGDWFFCSHRAHYHYLLAGGSEDELADKISDGRSMFLFSKRRNFVTSAILAGCAPIACGVALANQQSGSKAHTWCFVGDGAEDEGNFYEAVRFATAHDLPITFVIEDNGVQVDTPYAERWKSEQRFEWGPKVVRYHYLRTFPHGGAGLPPGSVAFKPEVVARFVSGN